jgi:hypothetical protein
VSGVVTAEGSGAPLADVSVSLYTSTGQWATDGWTDAAGTWISRGGLPTGTYYAKTGNSASYVNEVYDDVTCLNCSSTGGTPIGVTVGAVTSGIDFELALGGRISGTLTDAATGAPVSGVTVWLYEASA